MNRKVNPPTPFLKVVPSSPFFPFHSITILGTKVTLCSGCLYVPENPLVFFPPHPVLGATVSENDTAWTHSTRENPVEWVYPSQDSFKG